MADDTKAAGSKGLPTLPKKRPGPFDKLASLAETPEPPADLREQADRDPAMSRDATVVEPPRARNQTGGEVPVAKASKRRGRPSIAVEGEQIFLQTTLPLPMFQAFKMHCIERRTTVREELRRLVEEMLARKRR